MTEHGQALRMRYQLAALKRQHQAVADVYAIPLVPPVDTDMILEGYGATCETDLDHCKFRPYAFTILPWDPPPPLHLRHATDRTVGHIDDLHYDNKGNFRIRAVVTDRHAARVGGFSVGARVIDYQMKDVDTGCFSALVTRAELTEISLTPIPSNPQLLLGRSIAAG
jgi:hypothetical protein